MTIELSPPKKMLTKQERVRSPVDAKTAKSFSEDASDSPESSPLRKMRARHGTPGSPKTSGTLGIPGAAISADVEVFGHSNVPSLQLNAICAQHDALLSQLTSVEASTQAEQPALSDPNCRHSSLAKQIARQLVAMERSRSVTDGTECAFEPHQRLQGVITFAQSAQHAATRTDTMFAEVAEICSAQQKEIDRLKADLTKSEEVAGLNGAGNLRSHGPSEVAELQASLGRAEDIALAATTKADELQDRLLHEQAQFNSVQSILARSEEAASNMKVAEERSGLNSNSSEVVTQLREVASRAKAEAQAEAGAYSRIKAENELLSDQNETVSAQVAKLKKQLQLAQKEARINKEASKEMQSMREEIARFRAEHKCHGSEMHRMRRRLQIQSEQNEQKVADLKSEIQSTKLSNSRLEHELANALQEHEEFTYRTQSSKLEAQCQQFQKSCVKEEGLQRQGEAGTNAREQKCVADSLESDRAATAEAEAVQLRQRLAQLTAQSATADLYIMSFAREVRELKQELVANS